MVFLQTGFLGGKCQFYLESKGRSGKYVLINAYEPYMCCVAKSLDFKQRKQI